MDWKCTYCGHLNSEQATRCSGCGTKFEPPVSAVEPIPVMLTALRRLLSPSKHEAELSARHVSAGEWSAREAWKCIGMFLVFGFVLDVVWSAIGTLSPGFHVWSRTGAGHLAFSGILYSINILTMLYFARLETMPAFLRAFGLDHPPSNYIWFAVVSTLALRVTGYFIIAAGWSKGATFTSLWWFRHSVGLDKYLNLAPLLLAPFCEELYMRGFLYRAFRGSYSVALSTFLILGYTAWTHWGQYHRSWVAALGISTLTVLQCFLRERTGNLRDCIICHLVFNASGLLVSSTFQ